MGGGGEGEGRGWREAKTKTLGQKRRQPVEKVKLCDDYNNKYVPKYTQKRNQINKNNKNTQIVMIITTNTYQNTKKQTNKNNKNTQIDDR